MEFLQFNAFYLFIFPLVLSLFLLSKKTNTLENYFSDEILEKLTISNNGISQKSKNTLLLLSLILFIITIARPVSQEKVQKVKEDLIPIIVAIDVSKSMLANDIYPNRLLFAKQKLLKILEQIQQSAVGVVLFAKSSFVLSPVTQDFNSLAFLVKNLDSGLNFDNGSNVLAMLEASNNLLEDFNSKNIILLSDGGNKEDYTQEIKYAQENKIKVYAIGIASDKLTAIPSKDGFMTDSNGKIVTVGLNKSISKLSMQSGAGYINYSLNSNDIDTILKEINSQAKKEFMNSSKIKTYTELFYYPLALALLFVFLAFSSFSFKRREALALLFILPLIISPEARADLLDFRTIKDAKDAYAKKEYKKSEQLYKTIDSNEQTQYNIANNLYQQKKYKEATSLYKNIQSDDTSLRYKSLHNLGNSYVKQNKLEDAKKSYEQALKLQEDEQTKQNLELVNKALEEKKKKENKDNKQNKDNKDNKDDKKDQDKQNKQDKDKKSDSKDKKKNEQQDKKSKEQKDKEQEKKDKNKQKEQDKIDKEKTKQQSEQSKKPSQKEISDLEEKKWLDKITNQKNRTFLRRFESESSEDNIKNPW